MTKRGHGVLHRQSLILFTNFHLHGSVNIEFLPIWPWFLQITSITYKFNQLKHATAYFPPLRRLQSKWHCSSDQARYRRQWQSHWAIGRSSSSFDKTYRLNTYSMFFTKLVVYSARCTLVLHSQETCHVRCRPRHHVDSSKSIHIYSRAFNLTSTLSI